MSVRSPWCSRTAGSSRLTRSSLGLFWPRMMPWTSYPLPTSSSARYRPSWPVIPVMRAVGMGAIVPHGSVTASSVRSALAEDGSEGLGEDVEVLEHRPVVDVVEVQADGLAPRQVGTAGDLPEPRHARPDPQAAVDVGLVRLDLARQRRGGGGPAPPPPPEGVQLRGAL